MKQHLPLAELKLRATEDHEQHLPVAELKLRAITYG